MFQSMTVMLMMYQGRKRKRSTGAKQIQKNRIDLGEEERKEGVCKNSR